MTDDELEAAFVEEAWKVYRKRHRIPWTDPQLTGETPQGKWMLCLLAACRGVEDTHGILAEDVKARIWPILISCREAVDDDGEYYGPHEALVEISSKVWLAMRGPLIGDGDHR